VDGVRRGRAAEASISASPRVGWGWIGEREIIEECAISSASAPSEIIVLASGPTMWTPSSCFVFLSATTFTKPSVSLIAMALPSAAKGNLPTTTSMPLAFASSAVRPTVAISGSVNTAPGIEAQSFAALWPAMTSATTSPSFVALCASSGGPDTSPMA
jgi:hypothetical protein